MGEGGRLKSKVVFFKNIDKLGKALLQFDLESFYGKRVPIKLHMGEPGNKHFIKPSVVKVIIEELKKVGVKPFLFDTPVTYRSPRNTKEGYEKVAKMHGFYDLGCPVVIGDEGVLVEVEEREFEVAKEIFESSHLVALSHVKGHILSGFGGAIKNFGMGGVTRKSKKAIHDGSQPIYNKDLCTLCKKCQEVCPFGAIEVKEKWIRNEENCLGCGKCVDACKMGALSYKEVDLQFLLAAAAKACIHGKEVLYINQLKNIAKSCDCDPHADPIICPDIGYLVSKDIVAIDKASLDLVKEKKGNVFKEVNGVDPEKQVRFASSLGLGNLDYELVEI